MSAMSCSAWSMRELSDDAGVARTGRARSVEIDASVVHLWTSGGAVRRGTSQSLLAVPAAYTPLERPENLDTLGILRPSRLQAAPGPSSRTRCTSVIASRSRPSQSSAFSPTRRTHQASASARLRATPASTRVSSTSRSGCRSRVITGTARLVNTDRTGPHSAPHAILRPNRCSASRAMWIRSSRVSSRNREIRPFAAAVASAPSGSPSTPSGAARVPTTRISSRSVVTSAAPVNHASGRRPWIQPATSVSLVVITASCVSV